MKITIDQAFGVEVVYNALRDKQIPIKTAYKLSKLMKGLNSDLEFYRNKLQELLNEYADKDESGNFIINESQTSVQLKPETAQECMKKMQELQEIEIDVVNPPLFNVDELDGLTLNFSELQALMPFIEE